MKIRPILVDHIIREVHDDECAVLLSGGVDSASVAIAAQDAGKKINAYSFHLANTPSYDFDMAQKLSEEREWNFTPIVVPTDRLAEDWERLVKHGCRKKTHFETVFPFLYVYEQISEKYILTGWGADGYFGVSKKAMMRYSSFKKKRKYVHYCKNNLKAESTSNETRVNWYQFRKNYLEGDCAGLEQHTRLAESFDKIHVTPYLDERVYDILMRMTWQELNKPKQKNIIREEFDLHSLKPHLNLHLGSGVNKLFESLLKDDTINFNGRKRMMDVARDHYQKHSDLSEFLS